MMRSQPAEYGRIAALGLLALLVLLLWAGPVRAYLDLLDSGAEQVAQQTGLLQRYRELSGHPPAAATANSPAGTGEIMLPPLPEAQALALLQQTIKTTAQASRVEIRSLQVLRSETLAEALRIGVRINAAGDIAGVARLLDAIERVRPVLYADNLQLRARPGADINSSAPQLLDLQLDIAAFSPAAPGEPR